MPSANPIQNAFNAGELAPELDGRTDIGKYASGCSTMLNFFPMVQGPARRRGGTWFVQEVADSGNRTWLATFEFASDECYVLEFGHQYVRFFNSRAPVVETHQDITGITKANPGVLTYSGTDPSNGQCFLLDDIVGMTELNGRYVVVSSVDTGANTFQLRDTKGDLISTSAYTAYTSGGTMSRVYHLTTPWGVDDLITSEGTFALQMVQSGDILYICHPDYAPRKLSRFGATNWTLTTLVPDGGPFEDYDPDQTTTVYASARTGSGITITASAATFAATDVGRILYIEQKKANAIGKWEVGKSCSLNDLRRYGGRTYKCTDAGTTGANPPVHSVGAEYDGDAATACQWEFQDPGYGWVEITGYTSTTVVTATVLSAIPDQAVGSGNTTTRWAFGAWGSVSGYPSHVCFFRNRLCFARASDRKLWFSVAADYENFNDRDSGGEVTAEMAVTLTIESDQTANAIQYLIATDVLVIGTTGAEHICAEQTDSDPFGPSNARIVRSSGYGARGVRPVQVGGSVLFVQRSGRRLREITYDAIEDGHKTLDMNVVATHIVPRGTSISQICYQKEPHSIVWCARSDGVLLGFTYSREQYTEPPFGGWHRHQIGGDGIVESVVSIPSPDNDRDDLWMIVRRTIGTDTRRYVEYMRAEHESGDNPLLAFYLDSGATYYGVSTTAINGMWHLEGEEVEVWADGAAHPPITVTNGTITLQWAASIAHIGYSYTSTVATMRLEVGSPTGTTQGKTKRIHKIGIRFLESLGGYVGPNTDTVDEILFRKGSDLMDTAVPLFTGDKSVPWPGGYEVDGKITYTITQPCPVTLVAFMPELVTY